MAENRPRFTHFFREKRTGKEIRITSEEALRFNEIRKRGVKVSIKDVLAAADPTVNDARLPDFFEAGAEAFGEAKDQLVSGVGEVLGLGAPPDPTGLRGPGSIGAGADVALGLAGLPGAASGRPHRSSGSPGTASLPLQACLRKTSEDSWPILLDGLHYITVLQLALASYDHTITGFQALCYLVKNTFSQTQRDKSPIGL